MKNKKIEWKEAIELLDKALKEKYGNGMLVVSNQHVDSFRSLQSDLEQIDLIFKQ